MRPQPNAPTKRACACTLCAARCQWNVVSCAPAVACRVAGCTAPRMPRGGQRSVRGTHIIVRCIPRGTLQAHRQRSAARAWRVRTRGSVHMRRCRPAGERAAPARVCAACGACGRRSRRRRYRASATLHQHPTVSQAKRAAKGNVRAAYTLTCGRSTTCMQDERNGKTSTTAAPVAYGGCMVKRCAAVAGRTIAATPQRTESTQLPLRIASTRSAALHAARSAPRSLSTAWTSAARTPSAMCAPGSCKSTSPAQVCTTSARAGGCALSASGATEESCRRRKHAAGLSFGCRAASCDVHRLRVSIRCCGLDVAGRPGRGHQPATPRHNPTGQSRLRPRGRARWI